MITYRDSWFELALLDNVGGFPRHTHDEFVISTNLNGVEQVWLDGTTFDVETGAITTYNPHQLQGSEHNAARWQCASLYVQPDAFEQFFERPFLFSQGMQTAPQWARWLAGLASQPLQSGVADMRQEQIIMLLAGLMDDETPTSPERGRDNDSGRIKRLKAHLLNDLSAPPNLDQLARQESISAAHLVRSFHQAVGMPPLAWLMQRRMHHARELLRQGMSITQVALSVGFADQAHFTKAFTRFNAMTPGRFQRINL